MAIQNMAVTGNSDTRTTEKIRSFFGKKSEENWIEVDFSRWGSRDNDTVKFQTLKEAILKSHSIKFKYVDPYGRETQREVNPLKLVFKSKSWYLKGFDVNKDAYRTFKINRMLDLKSTNNRFVRSDYDLPPLEQEYESKPRLIELIFPPEVAFRVYEEFDEGAIERDDEGNMRVTVQMPEDDWMYSYFMSFGKNIHVVQPKDVGDTLRRKHEEAII
jgi:predicted DNA-binding transcriptional regulator YafY